LIVKSITQGLSATCFYDRDYDKEDAIKKTIKISLTHLYASLDVQHQPRKNNEDSPAEDKYML